MRKIYGVGCMKVDLENPKCKHFDSTYLQGLYTSFEDAEAAVLANEGDMVEFYYNVLIIEEMYLYGEGNDKYESRKIHWYKADFIGPETIFGKEPVVSKIECPEVFKNICHFLGGF